MCSYIYLEIDIEIYIYTCNIYVSYHDVVNDEKIKIITRRSALRNFYSTVLNLKSGSYWLPRIRI